MKAIERLYKYIDYKGVKPTPFEKEIGLSNGYLGKQLTRNADLGEGVLIKIIENCPEISPEWLLTGKGSMLKSQPNAGPPELVPDAMHYKDLAEARLEIIEGLKYKIANLEKKVDELKEIRHLSALYANVAEPAPELIKKRLK
jgi:hypothetical protein